MAVLVVCVVAIGLAVRSTSKPAATHHVVSPTTTTTTTPLTPGLEALASSVATQAANYSVCQDVRDIVTTLNTTVPGATGPAAAAAAAADLRLAQDLTIAGEYAVVASRAATNPTLQRTFLALGEHLGGVVVEIVTTYRFLLAHPNLGRTGIASEQAHLAVRVGDYLPAGLARDLRPAQGLLKGVCAAG